MKKASFVLLIIAAILAIVLTFPTTFELHVTKVSVGWLVAACFLVSIILGGFTPTKPALIALLCILPLSVFGQSNEPVGVVSKAVTGAVAAVTGGAVAPGAIPSVGQAFGQLVSAGYLYIATNGQAGVGMGNTMNSIGHGALKTVTFQSIDLPKIVPSNGVVDVTFDLLTTQFYAPDKTHLGLGGGVYTVWNIGWLAKLHLGIFQMARGLELGAGISPDIDETINMRFAARTTVVFGRVGLKLAF